MNILLVDDEAMVLESVERILVTLGSDTWNVTCAGSGGVALETLATAEFDLVITDMKMPGMDGAELLRQVATRWPRVARVALSAEASELQAVRAAGVAHQFLGKPCQPEQMLGMVKRIEGLAASNEARIAAELVGAVPSLPGLPDVFVQLRKLLDDPRADLRRVVEVVRQDPAITLKVMQLASSSFFYRGSAISDVAGAVNRLGLRLIANLILVERLLAEATEDPFDFGADARGFFRAAMIAEAAVAGPARDHASLAVLLCPIGRRVMIAAAPEKMRVVTELTRSTAMSLVDAERRTFGTSHAAVGAHLITLWGLATAIASAVAHQHDSSSCSDAVQLAVQLANRDVRGLGVDLSLVGPDLCPLLGAWDLHKLRLGGCS